MIGIKFTGEPEKIQRLNFVRLKVNMPISFRVIYDERKMSAEYKATICDISGSEVRLSSEIRFIPGMLIFISIDLKEFGHIKVKGRVISTYEPNTTDANTLLNEAGIKFESIDLKTQDSIMIYIFYKLRKLRQKGLS
jgi:c-di-GMP-binding flagellar brake protein YcgR